MDWAVIRCNRYNRYNSQCLFIASARVSLEATQKHHKQHHKLAVNTEVASLGHTSLERKFGTKVRVGATPS